VSMTDDSRVELNCNVCGSVDVGIQFLFDMFSLCGGAKQDR
jgi:hypothetical protein